MARRRTAAATAPTQPAPDLANAEATVVVRGVLTDDGVECQAMRGEDGALYTLVGLLGGCHPGDAVEVEGVPQAASFCMQGTTLAVTAIHRRIAVPGLAPPP